MTYNVPLEDLISNIGGCGKFQWILVILVHMSKTLATWTMIHMTFNGQEPAFSCIDNKQSARNGTVHSVKFNVSRDGCPSSNVSGCKRFLFKEDMQTIVSEVCIHYSYTFFFNFAVFLHFATELKIPYPQGIFFMLNSASHQLTNFPRRCL